MSDTELQFRTAAFGGFQKQDVLNYIEASNQTHRDKLDELNRELEEAKKTGASLEEEAAVLRRQAAEDAETVQRLEGELEQARSQAEELKGRLDEAEAELTRVREALAGAESRLAQAEPAAQAYEKVKDRTASIELEAHCRAQAVEEEAEERVERARQDLEQWLHKVQHSYEELRTDMDATISHTAGELEKVQAALESITNQFCAQDERLEKMIQACVGERKVPEPLPLEEKQQKKKG